jgi:hydroxypyruvate isomerase
MPKFSANLTMLFTEVGLLDRFDAAAEAGFEAVELQFPYAFPKEALAEQVARRGLVLALHNLPPGDWDKGERGLACLPGREAEFREGVATAIGYARALGAQRLNGLAGIPPAGADGRLVRDTLVRNLRYAARALADEGIRLLVEPLNAYDMPGFYLTNSRSAMALIDEVGDDNLWLQYDVYHMQRSEGELAATIAALLPRIAHVQIADNPGRHEPGTGEINYPFLFQTLDRLGYDGWVGCEYWPAATTEAGLGWIERAQSDGKRKRRRPDRA